MWAMWRPKSYLNSAIIAAVLLGTACSAPSNDVAISEGVDPAGTSEQSDNAAPSGGTMAEPVTPALPELYCEPVTEATQLALEAAGGQQANGTTRRQEDWALVHVGEGIQPGETWDVVAYRTTRTRGDNRLSYAFLTNTLSDNQPSGSRWISLGPAEATDAIAFQGVNWPEATLTVGRQARATALGCLGSTPWNPVPDGEFVCEPPTQSVMEWINGTLGNRVGEGPQSDLDPGRVAMVQVGPGNDPNEMWWVVVFRTTNSDGRLVPFGFLTNSPSENQPSGETWISVTTHLNLTGPDGWGQVRWSPERIAHGREAEVFAFECLG